jgi:hypothetical protein
MGASAEVSGLLAAAMFAAAGILLYTHNARFMEAAVLIGSGLLGVAAAAGCAHSGQAQRRVDASGAIPAAVVFLPGLALGTRPSHAENLVPDICFWLVALAPLALAPLLIPRLAQQNRWLLMLLRLVLVLTPLGVAVALAARYEELPF